MIRQAASIVFIVVALLLSLELALRAFVGSPAPVPPPQNPVVLSKLPPNTTRFFTREPINGGQTIQYRINRYGFRGDDFSATFDGKRVMVYGDSNIFARFSVQSATFVHQLGQRLAALTSLDIQTINAGRKGYGPDQVYLRLRDELAVWRPDLVVVHLFADNDHGDMVRNNFFRYDDDELKERQTQPILRSTLLGYLKHSAIGLKVLDYSNRLRQRRVRNMGTRKQIDWYLQVSEQEYVNYMEDIKESSGDHYDYDLALRPDGPSSILKEKMMQDMLRKIAVLVESYEDISLIFVIQPSVYDISTNHSMNYKILEGYSKDYTRERLSESMERALKELRANYINLFEEFKTDGETTYYFRTMDNHWNDAGQKKAAGVVARYIVDNQLL